MTFLLGYSGVQYLISLLLFAARPILRIMAMMKRFPFVLTGIFLPVHWLEGVQQSTIGLGVYLSSPMTG